MADNEKKYDSETYKQWGKWSGKNIFLSVKPLLRTGKFIVEIGASEDGDVESTLIYTDAVPLTAQLKQLANNDGKLPNDEFSYVTFGGGEVDGKTVARVFKIEPWQGKTDRIRFAAALFPGKKTGTGAFQPDGPPESTHEIQLKPDQVMHLALRCELALVHFVSNFREDPFAAFNGELRND